MTQREYLEKMRTGWRPSAKQRLEYLETCLWTDNLSKDSRAQLRREIEVARKAAEDEDDD